MERSAISNCANWHHNGPLIMAITQRPLATASCRHCLVMDTPPSLPSVFHGAALFGCYLLCFLLLSILNRRCPLILCANTLNGNFDEQEDHRGGAGFVAPTILSDTHTLCYPQGQPCKVPAFAQPTHFSRDICESKTNFRSCDSEEKPLKGLVVLLFDLFLSLCSLHICHCFFSPSLLLPAAPFSSSFSARNPCVNMLPSKRSERTSNCVQLFSSVL